MLHEQYPDQVFFLTPVRTIEAEKFNVEEEIKKKAEEALFVSVVDKSGHTFKVTIEEEEDSDTSFEEEEDYDTEEESISKEWKEGETLF